MDSRYIDPLDVAKGLEGAADHFERLALDNLDTDVLYAQKMGQRGKLFREALEHHHAGDRPIISVEDDVNYPGPNYTIEDKRAAIWLGRRRMRFLRIIHQLETNPSPAEDIDAVKHKAFIHEQLEAARRGVEALEKVSNLLTTTTWWYRETEGKGPFKWESTTPGSNLEEIERTE